MPIFRSMVTWTGFVGSPGYTNFHFMNPEEVPTQAVIDNVNTRTRTFFEAIKGLLPGSIRIDYPTLLERYDTITGVLEQGFPMAGVTTTSGTGLTTFSSATGACVSWGTNIVLQGRKMRGRTFIVPLATGSYDTDGTLNNTSRTTLNTAATTFISEMNDMVLGVWHKPSGAGEPGVAAQITSATVRDRTAVLRSRRD